MNKLIAPIASAAAAAALTVGAIAVTGVAGAATPVPAPSACGVLTVGSNWQNYVLPDACEEGIRPVQWSRLA